MKAFAMATMLVVVTVVTAFAGDGSSTDKPRDGKTVDTVCVAVEPPDIESIGDTTCGGGTAYSSPVLRWEQVTNNRGYNWQIRRTSGTIVGLGYTTWNQNRIPVGPFPNGTYTARVLTRGGPTPECDSDWSEECAFTIGDSFAGQHSGIDWWPDEPKVGQTVRFAGVSSGDPLSWHWDFGDGTASDALHPEHVFEADGDFIITRDVEFETGHSTETRTITVAGVVTCGDGMCETGETAWSCPSDCALPAEQTGRTIGSDRRPTVPVAAGNLRGLNRNRWFTEAWIHNPGDERARFVVEYTALGSIDVLQEGTFDLEPGHTLYWENIVEDVFSKTGSGSLWIDSDVPVLFLTRTYAVKSEKGLTTGGTFGGSFHGCREGLTLGRDDGKLYVIGLREDGHFSSDLHLQNRDDAGPITVKIDVFDETGARLGGNTLEVKSHGKYQANLRYTLGVDDAPSAYATAEVTRGDGRLCLAGAVIDSLTDDPTFIDAIHPGQVAGAAGGQQHTLVAAVAHTNGAYRSVWRSKLVIANPGAASQEVTLRYVPEDIGSGVLQDPSEVEVVLPAGQQLSWDDVLAELFDISKSTQGALHVFSSGGLMVDSRTYNLRSDGGTFGLSLPGLKSGDLASPAREAIIVGLAHSETIRTNMGFAEYLGQDTPVDVYFSTTILDRAPIGSFENLIMVPAYGHRQLLNVIEQIVNSPDETINGIEAEVSVDGGGMIYPYATTIDNLSGDPTAYTAAVE